MKKILSILVLLLLVGCYPDTVNIPSSSQVRSFCKSKGYDSGWVSSTCDMNEVTCHSDIGELEKYDCVKWEVNTSNG